MTRPAPFVAALALLVACAGSFVQRNAPTARWTTTLTRAQELAIAGRFQDADRMLQDFGIQNPRTAEAAEALYWRAAINLDPANQRGSLDSGLVYLERYLGSGGKLSHLLEAASLRRLGRAAQQLARVEGALQQARAATTDQPRESDRGREEAVREIQRLREELAQANAELERIKKRLAAPTKP